MEKNSKEFLNEFLYRRLLYVIPDSIGASEVANALQDEVMEDIAETADPDNWHSGDVEIALGRVLKKRLLDDKGPASPADPAEDVCDEYSEDMRGAVAYINEQLEPEDKAIIVATVDKNYKCHMNPAFGIDEDRIIDLLEEYGDDHDLPEGWWEEECELDDIVLLIDFKN